MTTYIGGLFERITLIASASTGSHDTLHILDSAARVATVHAGPPLPGDTSPAVAYHLGDHIGSSTVVLDTSGAVFSREEYTPYAETSFGSYAKKRYRHAAKERDEESGLYYRGARYYAPWLGRWTSPDPAGMSDGVNLYCYVHGNPVTHTDSTGQGDDAQASAPSKPQLTGVSIATPVSANPQVINQSGTQEPSKLIGDATARADPSSQEEGGKGYELAVGMFYGPPRPTTDLDIAAIAIGGVQTLPMAIWGGIELGLFGGGAAAAGGGSAGGGAPVVAQLSAAGAGGGELSLNPVLAVGLAIAIQQAVATGGALAMAVATIDMIPYGQGGGHHIPAKSLFQNDPNYDPSKAPAIPKEVLKQMGGQTGNVHTNISRAQGFLYRDYLATGQPLTWAAVRKIETNALVAAGIDFGTARATVNAAITELQAMGVSEGGMVITW